MIDRMHRYDRYVWGPVSHPGGITITLMDARVAMNTAGAVSLIHNIFRHPTSDSGKIWISYFLGVKAQTNMNTFSHWYLVYRVSSKTVCTPILLFSRVPEHIQKNFWPFFNSPGDEDFKTHLTFLPTWKIDLVTEQNVRQTGF